MSTISSSTPTPSEPPPEAAHAHGPPSGGQIAVAITGVKAKLTKAMAAETLDQTKGAIEKQLADNKGIALDIEQLQGQLNELKNTDPPPDPNTVADLQGQITALNRQMTVLSTATIAVANSFMLSGPSNLPELASPSPGVPILSVPVPTTGKPTTENKVNLMLSPSLATLIFSIMEKVVSQKLKNIDTYRQFMTAYIGQTEQFALSAAQSTMMQGQLQAQATMTQAMGLLIGAGLQMGLGVASIAATSFRVAQINKKFDTEVEAVPDKDSQDGKAELSAISTRRYEAISNEIQSNSALKSLQLLENIAPNIAQGAGNMASAQYTIQAATAEASKMLFQQAIQAAQAIYQDMGQDIQSSSQDISAFLQAFTQISSSMTQQA